MTNAIRLRTRLLARGERGAVLLITTLAMGTLVIVASLAIDTGNWYVHARHLQTQADAAAFAGADVLAAGIENSSCSDSAVKTEVANYDGSGTSNQQVTPSGGIHDVVNGASFYQQTTPGDTGLTGSPCTDAAVDVKMTETNLTSFLPPFVHPQYANKQARVSAQTISVGAASPFILPNIATPNDVAVFVVGEDPATPSFSTDTILNAIPGCSDNGNVPPCVSSSNGGATWSVSGVSTSFGSAPVSVVVAQSTSAIAASAVTAVTSGTALASFCTNTTGVTCYDKTDGGPGLTYTRTYAAPTSSSIQFPASAAPAVEDVTATDSPADPTSQCKSSGSTKLFTGFVASGSACLLNVNAHLDFGTGTYSSCNALATTLAATLTVTASSGGSAPLACPNTGGNPSAPGSADGTWTTSSTISIPAGANAVTFGLKWSRTAGGCAVQKGTWENGGVKTTCGTNTNAFTCTGSNACTNDFKIIQRVFMGAYDQQSATGSHSGAVAGVALTGALGELMATPANAPVNNLAVTIDFQALTDTSAGTNGYVPGTPFTDIAYGSNQGNGLGDCGQGNGNPVQQDAIAGTYKCTTYPIVPASIPLSTACSTNPCPGTVPGNKFIQWLAGGLAARIYGCPESSSHDQNGCTPHTLSAAACAASPNYWSTQNLLSSVLSNSSDPRLLSVMVTDSQALPNGSHSVPVRHYAAFYVTGWTGDPCSGVSVSGQSVSNSLYYTNEDAAPTDAAGDTFLVGHFVKYFQSGATPSGNPCTQGAIDNCTLTVTR